jgi:hypothetical protein
MIAYKNLGGDSGVSAYNILESSIEVRFRDGMIYLYTYQSAGREMIENMKRLATAGTGLNSYISRTVKKRFSSKKHS